MERIILRRISPLIEPTIPLHQAGFLPNRGCCNQVLSLTSHLEKGFNDKLKSGAAFIDFSAAYDTVWKNRLLWKVAKIIPCPVLLRHNEMTLGNRNFRVFLEGQKSKTRVLNNSLPQGSVLAPILFNVYVHDMPDTVSKKFAYADDTCIVSQSKHFEDVENTLTSDFTLIENVFKKWRLRLNPSKTMVTAFHPNNKEANRELAVQFCGETSRNSKLPVYLGISLDRALTFKAHLQKVAAKIKTRNSLINKLAGTSWGSSTHVLRTSTLALTYSVAEYCAPISEGSQAL